LYIGQQESGQTTSPRYVGCIYVEDTKKHISDTSCEFEDGNIVIPRVTPPVTFDTDPMLGSGQLIMSQKSQFTGKTLSANILFTGTGQAPSPVVPTPNTADPTKPAPGFSLSADPLKRAFSVTGGAAAYRSASMLGLIRADSVGGGEIDPAASATLFEAVSVATQNDYNRLFCLIIQEKETCYDKLPV